MVCIGGYVGERERETMDVWGRDTDPEGTDGHIGGTEKHAGARSS